MEIKEKVWEVMKGMTVNVGIKLSQKIEIQELDLNISINKFVQEAVKDKLEDKNH